MQLFVALHLLQFIEQSQIGLLKSSPSLNREYVSYALPQSIGKQVPLELTILRWRISIPI